MGKKESFETVWDFLENHFRFFLLLFSFLLLFASGMLLAKIWQLRSKPQLEYSVRESGESRSDNLSDDEPGTDVCVVDVSGAIEEPGVYELGEGSRVKDAVNVAGGLSSLADEDWVAKNLNLAAPVSDGQKIYIPEKGEAAEVASVGSQSGDIRGTEALTVGSSGKINLNQASKDDLETLPGIGPALAGRIIEYREKTPFESVEELTAVKGIGGKTLQDLRDKVFVP